MFEYSIDQVALLTVQLAGPVGYTKTRKSLFVSKLVRQNTSKGFFSLKKCYLLHEKDITGRVGGGIRWWDYDDKMSPQTRPQSAHKNTTHIADSIMINPTQIEKYEPRKFSVIIMDHPLPPPTPPRHPLTSPQPHWQRFDPSCP